ncbi:MAG: AraC family transcriptional regulator [Spongiibacteraceae bacterium]
MSPATALHVGQAEIEQQFSLGRARILHFVDQTVDVSGCPSGYRVDMSLTPRRRNGGVCFSERWSAHQFKPIGSLYVLPPGQTVRARGDCGNHSSVVCDLEPHAIDEWFDGDVCWSDRHLEAMLDIASPNMRASLQKLSEELRNPGFASAAMCELLIAQVAIESARHCQAIEYVKDRGGLSPLKLKLIDERLREIGAAPSLQELAVLCKLSVRQLTRGFRISRGCSIGEYLAQNRLEHAKRLLAANASVKEVALSLGFASPANFSTTFRHATGETPSQFRERSIHA